VRIREKFGYRVSDAMWAFFQQLGVIDADGKPGAHFGDPSWVYLQYRRRQGDTRTDGDILAEATQQIAVVRSHGVLIAEGHGARSYDLAPELDKEVRYLYEDSRKCIRAELPSDFAKKLNATAVATLSANRSDYILHPTTGEALQPGGTRLLHALKAARNDEYNVQIVVSDGLNALAITDPGHLEPYLTAVRANLKQAGYSVAPDLILVTHGRVRAGYRIGETLYGTAPDPNKRYAILHVIGERPGSGHHAFSVYITAPPASTWAKAGLADHNITKVVSGIADTQLHPAIAAVDTVTLLGEIARGGD
jgi:ethanolamine ammonia-lyase large subunit